MFNCLIFKKLIVIMFKLNLIFHFSFFIMTQIWQMMSSKLTGFGVSALPTFTQFCLQEKTNDCAFG